jgi:hypothetical protein
VVLSLEEGEDDEVVRSGRDRPRWVESNAGKASVLVLSNSDGVCTSESRQLLSSSRRWHIERCSSTRLPHLYCSPSPSAVVPHRLEPEDELTNGLQLASPIGPPVPLPPSVLATRLRTVLRLIWAVPTNAPHSRSLWSAPSKCPFVSVSHPIDVPKRSLEED